MNRARPTVRCPLCGAVEPAAWLRVSAEGVELGCRACDAATRYPPFEREPTPSDFEAATRAVSQSAVAEGAARVDDPFPEEDSFGSMTIREKPISLPQSNAAAPVSLSLGPAATAPTAASAAAPAAPTAPTAVPAVATPSPQHAELLAVVDRIATVPPELAARYRKVVEGGDQIEAHRALLQQASAADQLNQLGLIYRYRLERSPQDRTAAQMRDRLLAAAMASLGPTTKPQEVVRKTRRFGAIGAGIFLLLCGLFAASLLLRSGCFGP